ncbi:phosphonates transport system permease protein [Renibacterium salmoninarum ATCC 33209]|uniref:Phosphonates transport system permease protein n=1 Tax=Renibacterium salmoninarum (strain ATCC 33209 / DSM 20767 / JCM 11484 / NBRC 15589 / NCIMB 2235) TaxID=288705 RepID=A9WLW8_RENSM|nr:phosphonate ABC transporter, permease protein PhnE [Renibacterium salmoninarum]ABY22149.1 phosphonates transport system permease protein [Renibacterium salmoninarum ATCC 33209]
MATGLSAPPSNSKTVLPAGSERRLLPRPSARSLGVAAVLLALFLGVVAVSSLGLSGPRIVSSLDKIGKFLARSVPMDFSEPLVLAQLTLQTLSVVICGTLLATIISIPIAYFAARNTSPHPALRWLARGMTVLARSIPELVLLIIVITLVAGGPVWPSIVAIGLHSVGMIGKLFADAIEQIDEGPRIAIRAAGGGKLQEFVSGVLLQVLPSWVATVLHRNDINLRASAILGIVGMPGLGYELKASIDRLDYQRMLAAALILFALCVVMEIIATVLCSMILGRASAGKSLGSRLSRKLVTTTANGDGSLATIALPSPAKRRTSAPWTSRRIQVNLIGWLILAVLIWAVLYANINWPDVVNAVVNLPQRFSTLFPLSFGDTPAPKMMSLLWETFYIALAGTLIAVLFSVPFGSFAARNIAANGAVHKTFRLVLLAIRDIPELLLAIILILATGFGPIAGAFALGLGGIGLLGKLLADSFEEVDSGPETALKATGARRGQIYAAATFPQATPAFVGHIFYMLDSNVRAATVLGVVGGGGVGFVMFEATSRSQYNVVFTIALMILAIVLVIEGVSMWVRKALKS